MNNSNNNIACVLSLGQSVLPVGHCLVYPAACKPPSAFCRRWALKVWISVMSRTWVYRTHMHMHAHIHAGTSCHTYTHNPHASWPTRFACVCALGIFQNGKQSARDMKKRPANRSLSLRKTQNPFPSLTHTYIHTAIHTHWRLSFCFRVSVCVCMWVYGWQTVCQAFA